MKTQLLLATLLVAGAASRADAVPEQIGLTARVVDAGTPITGAHTFTVRIFDAATGGAQQWTENDAATANDGTVYLTLGDQSALDATVLDGGPLWIELQVDSTVLAPRLSITSAAYAVRAGVAEDAEHLAGMLPTDFATANHNHNGTYLPVGATLSCTGTQKVTALGTNGSVVCGADVDTSLTLAGSGVAATAAHSDHNHTGVYLPVGATLACTGTQKVTALNPNGSVSCGADVDTDTNYMAGTGLTLTGTSFSVNFAGAGAATTAARSDHTHAEVCPVGYTTYLGMSGSGSPLCVKRVTSSVQWNTAASDCFLQHAGGELCTYTQLRLAAMVSPSVTLSAGYWLADRVDDNWVLRVNGTNNLDFDEKIEIVNTTVVGPGYYCCQRAH
jgi:hypothetical protein